jgi:prepilin-type N-terminal cleavage/methylation domain-containing protein
MRTKSKKNTQAGMSLIEMVVTLAIISIVSMGLMSMLWVNSWWLFKLSNKTDNVIAAQQFLDRFSAELRMAESVTNLTDTQLSIKIPVFESNRVGNAQYVGFPLNSYDILIYSVVPDSGNPGEYKIVRSITAGAPLVYHPEDGRSTIASTTILTGIVGPLNPSTGLPKTFEQSANGGITANVEMLRSLPNNRSSDPMSFRTQVFLHNSAIGLK